MFQGTFLVVRTHEDRLAWDWGLPLTATSSLLLVAFITWRRRAKGTRRC